MERTRAHPADWRSSAKHSYTLFFHDTHHRAVTDPESISRYALENFDGVLAFGEVIRDIYTRRGWSRRAWTWHEGGDATLFRPVPVNAYAGDVVWIGNWGDEERTAELSDYLCVLCEARPEKG